MASYRYDSNRASTDRFTQLQVVLDSGASMILEMGKTYDLSATEYERASQRIILVSSSTPPVAAPTPRFMPIVGDLVEGQVPVWSESQGAFVPGSASAVDLNGINSRLDALEDLGVKVNVLSTPGDPWTVRPAAPVVIWVGGGADDDPTLLMSAHDIWVPEVEV